MNSETVWTVWVLRAQIALLLIMATGLLGHKFNVLPFRLAFAAFALSVLILIVLGIVALIALGIGFFADKPQWLASSALGAVLGLVPAVVIVLVVGPSNFAAPPIHDISTDLEDPPVFRAAKDERQPHHNSLQHGGESLAAVQRRAYPEVESLAVPTTPGETFDAALAVVESRQWQVLDADAGAGRIEAVDETAFFGFKDDVVIRITPLETGSKVDVRSVSRVGRSDLGANAKRIKMFLAALEERVGQ